MYSAYTAIHPIPQNFSELKLFAQDQLLNGLSGPTNSWCNCWYTRLFLTLWLI